MRDKQIRILLVEDSDADAARFERLLATLLSPTYCITRTHSLAEARKHVVAGPHLIADCGLRIAEPTPSGIRNPKSAVGWDAIVTDLILADSQGLSTLVELVQVTGGTVPIVALLEKESEELTLRALREGAQDCLSKMSGDAQSFSRAIRFAIERHRIERTLREANRELKDQLHERSHEVGKIHHRLEAALAELKTTQSKIVEQERLRALGQMASGVAHDLNNALLPVLGYTDLLLHCPENLTNLTKVTDSLRIINTAARDAATIVRRLREFYRQRDEGEVFLPIHVKQLLEQVVTLTQPRWKDQSQAQGKEIRVVTQLQPTPIIQGNESELRQAITNLIFNAVDAMPEGGLITVRSQMDQNGDSDLTEYDENGEPVHWAAGPRVVISVTDTGIGMSQDIRKHCLEPFFSTKGNSGTGLGLAMVHGIVRRHEGRIDIESWPGRGTTFKLRLPVRHEAVEPSHGFAVTPHELRRKLRVLVVDDEPTVREVVAGYFAADGHATETACNGIDGLQKFHAGRFDLVITDRAMPEMNGEQLANLIKRDAPNKPVILLTGFGDLMKSSNENPESIDLIISKPVSLTTLRQAVAQVIAN